MQFDWSYYLDTHVPLIKQMLGSFMKAIGIEKGICGIEPGSPALYRAIADMTFDSIAAFQAVFEPRAQEILDDIAKFSSVSPTVQFSEIKIEARTGPILRYSEGTHPAL